MQILYKIEMSVEEYKAAYERGDLEFPSFQDECGICHQPGCSIGHGVYYRGGYGIDFIYHEDIPMKRYLCKNHLKKGIKPVTFSLLISHFAPYRQLTLRLLAYCASIWLRAKKNMKEALDILCYEHIEMEDMDSGGLSHIIIVIQSAWAELRLSRRSATLTLEEFIYNCGERDYRGAELLQSDYYLQQGGYKTNSRFLFGKASQFRNHSRDG
ncbi:MAG: hypothetical protein AB1629_08350 [Candidatus Omnitrophota bacterium]